MSLTWMNGRPLFLVEDGDGPTDARAVSRFTTRSKRSVGTIRRQSPAQDSRVEAIHFFQQHLFGLHLALGVDGAGHRRMLVDQLVLGTVNAAGGSEEKKRRTPSATTDFPDHAHGVGVHRQGEVLIQRATPGPRRWPRDGSRRPCPERTATPSRCSGSLLRSIQNAGCCTVARIDSSPNINLSRHAHLIAVPGVDGPGRADLPRCLR